MLQINPATASAEIVIDRSANTIVLIREFAASRARVFQAWTQPEHVKHWWDPAGSPLLECEIDLRLGGNFRFVNRTAHGDHVFTGVYIEITRPSLLVFKAMGGIGRLQFESIGGKARLTMRIECGSPAHLEEYLKMGIDSGTAKTLANLGAYLDATAS